MTEFGPPTVLAIADLPTDPSAVLPWNPAWTLSVGGKALYPRVDFALLRLGFRGFRGLGV